MTQLVIRDKKSKTVYAHLAKDGTGYADKKTLETIIAGICNLGYTYYYGDSELIAAKQSEHIWQSDKFYLDILKSEFKTARDQLKMIEVVDYNTHKPAKYDLKKHFVAAFHTHVALRILPSQMAETIIKSPYDSFILDLMWWSEEMDTFTLETFGHKTRYNKQIMSTTGVEQSHVFYLESQEQIQLFRMFFGDSINDIWKTKAHNDRIQRIVKKGLIKETLLLKIMRKAFTI